VTGKRAAADSLGNGKGWEKWKIKTGDVGLGSVRLFVSRAQHLVLKGRKGRF